MAKSNSPMKDAVRFGRPMPLARPALVALTVLLALIGLAASFSPALAQTEEPPTSTQQYCLSCHGNPDLNLTMPSGEVLSLFIDQASLDHSIHTQVGIECRACHTNIFTYPHPPIEFESARDLSRSFYTACQNCHSEQYDLAHDSIHAEELEAGNPNAPICTDCHTAHEVTDPDQPRAHVSQICGQCHEDVFVEYQDSVHGAALLGEDNPDVPVCTDCHGVHNIQDPRTEQFRVQTPELCAGCHADAEMMTRYNIRSDVYSLYETSWHGVDVSVFQARWPTLWHRSAVCTDCHGTHDMRRTEDPASRVHIDNRLGTCQQCHPSAGPNFVSAWVGHNRIDRQTTPFIYYTQVFYDNFAYLVLWISAIYVLLQVIRSTAARIKRSLS